jgi:hypothetical protein
MTITSVGVDTNADLLQKVMDKLGFKLVFQPGSNPAINIHIGFAVKEQNTSNASNSVGDVNNSTIGSVGSAHDVSVFVQNLTVTSLPDDVKRALTEAYRLVENLNLSHGLKGDVLADLTKVADELQKKQPDEGRLRHLLRNIKDIASPVASALSILASLEKLLM